MKILLDTKVKSTFFPNINSIFQRIYNLVRKFVTSGKIRLSENFDNQIWLNSNLFSLNKNVVRKKNFISNNNLLKISKKSQNKKSLK